MPVAGRVRFLVDTAVTVGTAYEYKLVLSRSPSSAATGYLLAGIRVDQTAPRGRVVVVVSDTIANGLPLELDAYQRDLGADGWTVHTITVPAVANYSGTGNFHQTIRSQIQSLNSAYPGELKDIVLLGKVPVPRSGLYEATVRTVITCRMRRPRIPTMRRWMAPGRMPALTSQYSTQANFFQNIAGDGLFDASTVSALGTGQQIDLGFGRIDTSAYGQASEIATVRMYLQKAGPLPSGGG